MLSRSPNRVENLGGGLVDWLRLALKAQDIAFEDIEPIDCITSLVGPMLYCGPWSPDLYRWYKDFLKLEDATIEVLNMNVGYSVEEDDIFKYKLDSDPDMTERGH